MAHLLRDLKYITELYEGKCVWAIQMKALISEALALKKDLAPFQYYQPNDNRDKLVAKLDQLLKTQLQQDHRKAKTLLKNLVKH